MIPSPQSKFQNPLLLYGIFWVLALALYWIAMRGGYVRDYPFFLQEYNDMTFQEFVMTPELSLYQGSMWFIISSLAFSAPIRMLGLSALQDYNQWLLFFYYNY